MDVFLSFDTEAHRLRAEHVTLIHYRRPPALGEEKQAAEAIGAKFLWPCSTKAVTRRGVEITTGKVIPVSGIVSGIIGISAQTETHNPMSVPKNPTRLVLLLSQHAFRVSLFSTVG